MKTQKLARLNNNRKLFCFYKYLFLNPLTIQKQKDFFITGADFAIYFLICHILQILFLL